MNLSRKIELISKIKLRPFYKNSGPKLGLHSHVSINATTTDKRSTKRELRSSLISGPSLQDFIRKEEDRNIWFQQSEQELPYATVQQSQNVNRKGKKFV